MYSFHYLNDAPIIRAADHPEFGGNVNGPSLIRAPDWMLDPPGQYLLYFAHHEGRAIRLAASDALTGPWEIVAPDPLDLERSRFATSRPEASQLHPEVRADIEAGVDGDYPHIASPDVWVDDETEQIRLYYHGRMDDGRQCSRVALSRDGRKFTPRMDTIDASYLRIFRLDDWHYAIAMPGRLYRSRDGLSGFEAGPRLTTEPIRHHAVLCDAGQWYLLWSRVGDSPERILLSILEISANWQLWQLGETFEIHRALKSWEGADLAPRESRYGACHSRENQLRDPAIFTENGKIYLLYTIAGEQGIAIGELRRIRLNQAAYD